MATVAEALAGLQAKVAENTSVDQSAIVLMQGIKAQLDEALALGDPAAIVAQVESLSAQLGSDNAALAAAVTANTPTPPSA